MDFGHSPRAQDYIARVQAFMRDHIFPAEAAYHAQMTGSPDWRQWRQPAIMEDLKAKARAAGLWNLFLKDPHHGAGLNVVEYAALAELMGHNTMAAEVFNCNAPDTGNMEVLHMYGTHAQQQQWMLPLLEGKIRSAFCMTEPEVASSDATNMAATAVPEGDEVVINGRKWFSSGIGHPNCKVLIFMGLTDPTAERHKRHSMILVPLDTPGVKIQRMLPAFGVYDEPFGHGEVTFDNVRVPKENIIAGLGRGFEIAQGRLGPGRIHHCMRCIGGAERALQLMTARGDQRVAFGKPLNQLGGNVDVIANARMAIEQARLLTLKAAWMMDTVGVKAAMSEISMIKVVAPNMAQAVIDAGIQMHGALGVTLDTPLSTLAAYVRTVRLADGPDEVHRKVVAKFELARQRLARGEA
ncbi:acyl-CoA dehydrogenase [Aquabacterium lacunae]|uniref:Acyl-CoA dehydrogenase n=1 Tax=Aquabacterium lacunae TaxID=2528630 RepID=A0A4Q9H4I3_9BURK|nr:acyl-CoA dehydrogenase family protein [Aquabacterium lacunae]TBO32354.1 acyl-CoA dehydrogenase [Aquabacterium lacunae]